MIEERSPIRHPHMRRASARTGAGHIDERIIGRRRAAVRDHDGRAVVARPQLYADGGELLAEMGNLRRRCPARVGAAVAVLFDPFRDRQRTHLFREDLGKVCIAQPNRPALRLVTRKQSLAAPALRHRREFPSEIRGIVDAGIHAETARGAEKMHRVARQHRAPATVGIGHQRATGNPFPVAQNLEGNVVAHRSEEAMRYQRFIRRVIDAGQLREEDEFIPAVETHHVAAKEWIQRPVLPPEAMRRGAEVFRGADVGGDHGATEIGLVGVGGLARVGDRKLRAHDTARTVASGNVGTAQRLGPARVAINDLNRDPVGILRPRRASPAKSQRHIGARVQVLEHALFDVHLIAAQERFGNLVGFRGIRHGAHLFGFRGHGDAGDLPAIQTREIHHVRHLLLRQPEFADRSRNPQAPVMLHRARVLRAAARLHQHAGLAVDHHALHAQGIKIKGQRHAHGATADDADREIIHPGNSKQ